MSHGRARGWEEHLRGGRRSGHDESAAGGAPDDAHAQRRRSARDDGDRVGALVRVSFDRDFQAFQNDVGAADYDASA